MDEAALPSAVIQYLKAHVQEKVAYDLLLTYGSKADQDEARMFMAGHQIKDGMIISRDRDTGEVLSRTPMRGRK